MQNDELFERLWSGSADMSEWTKKVEGGATRVVAEDVIAIHTSYFFGNVTALRTTQGLVLVDSGSRETGHVTLRVLREWDTSPVHTIIYTHGHIDHTAGAHLYDQEADENGQARPRVIAHRNVLQRFERYDATNGLNSIIMGRQFNQPGYKFPDLHRRPDMVYDDRLELEIGGMKIEVFHGRGETDDASFVWLPQQQILASGDFVIWAFPNAGNPRKAQRYAGDWAAALRKMERFAPETIIPGHGPVISGKERARILLSEGAEILEALVTQTIQFMNKGVALDEIIHQIEVPEQLINRPYLRPKYDDPEFVVRNIWHYYAGWFDGNPARLKPPHTADLAKEIGLLAGGSGKLARHAMALNSAGKIRIALQIIEYAAALSPADKDIQAERAVILEKCAEAEPSLIGRAIYNSFARDALARAADSD